MKTLVIATFNKHKLREFQALCRKLKIKAVSLDAFPKLKSPKEDGKTFQANAIKKAREIARLTGLPALADDSGICVDALKGKPGVDSAHFAGPKRDDEANNQKVLKKLARLPDLKRKAHYHCSIAVATPEKLIGVANGKVHGRILRDYRGKNGFGYDPLFYYPPYRKTFAEIPLSAKNKVSHRAQALKKAVALLERL